MDAFSQLTFYIEKAFQEKKHTITVFADLEKAYDTVWKAEILNILYAMGLRDNLPTFVQNFLTNQKIQCQSGSFIL